MRQTIKNQQEEGGLGDMKLRFRNQEESQEAGELIFKNQR